MRLLSRLIFIGLPMVLLSLQAADAAGVFLCGGCYQACMTLSTVYLKPNTYTFGIMVIGSSIARSTRIFGINRNGSERQLARIRAFPIPDSFLTAQG